MDRPKFNANLRQEARRLAVTALYAWQMSGNTFKQVLDDLFIALPPIFDKISPYDTDYFHTITEYVIHHTQTLDDHIAPYLDRDFSQINPIEHAILRMGAYELIYRTEIPYRVVMNEAILLAKEFGAVDSHKYINGVLDKLGRSVRRSQTAAAV